MRGRRRRGRAGRRSFSRGRGRFRGRKRMSRRRFKKRGGAPRLRSPIGFRM